MRLGGSVSIVVPAYNAARTLAGCIEALLRLDFGGNPYEIVVVNNRSSDDTGRIISRYPVIGIDAPTRGAAAARNAGLRAAKGSIIAFTDADCVAAEAWLKTLLEGSENPDIGCFAGEFAAQPQAGIIARYVEDRALISQKTLLSYVPPMVAGGNVAYRRAVFDAVGMFDESFLNGEDGELSWRMQKHGGFGIRYNEKAIVFHPHPSTLRHLIWRTYREGIGVSKLRLKHAADFPVRMISARHYRKVRWVTAAGLSLYPVRAARCHKEKKPWAKCLLYPILDKLCALAQETGVLHGLSAHGIPREIIP